MGTPMHIVRWSRPPKQTRIAAAARLRVGGPPRLVSVERQRACVQRLERDPAPTRRAWIAPRRELACRERDGLREPCADGIGEAAAEVVQLDRLHADGDDRIGRPPVESRQREDVVEADLVRRQLGASPRGHFGVAQHAQRARSEIEIDRVEDQNPAGAGDLFVEVETERAAVLQRHRAGKHAGRVQCLDRAHAEPLIGPQEVADAQNQGLRALLHALHRYRDRYRWGGYRSRGQAYCATSSDPAAGGLRPRVPRRRACRRPRRRNAPRRTPGCALHDADQLRRRRPVAP